MELTNFKQYWLIKNREDWNKLNQDGKGAIITDVTEIKRHESILWITEKLTNVDEISKFLERQKIP